MKHWEQFLAASRRESFVMDCMAALAILMMAGCGYVVYYSCGGK